MKKTISCILIFTVIAALFCACAKTDGGKSGGGKYDLSFTGVNGVKINPGENASVMDKFDKPLSVDESQSCFGKGMDRTYHFDGFSVITYPDESGSSDFIAIIELLSETVKTAKGAHVGMTQEEIEGLYGTDCIARGGTLIYTDTDGSSMTFYLKDGKVTLIRLACDL